MINIHLMELSNLICHISYFRHKYILGLSEKEIPLVAVV
jgi:hypothetical protein